MPLRLIRRLLLLPFRASANCNISNCKMTGGQAIEVHQKTKMFNVVFLSLTFMLVFTAFQTLGNIQQLIFDTAMKNGTAESGYVAGFSGDARTSAAILYATFTFFNWFAPSVVARLGPRITMMIGAGAYNLYVGQLLYPQNWLLYTSSALVGIGAAVIWVAQGSFLTVNSDKENTGRNSGIFWAMFQLSGFIGNIFAYFMFEGKTEIDEVTRNTVAGTLLGVGIGGMLLMIVFRPTPWADGDTSNTDSPTQALRRSGKLFTTKNMLLLSVTFFYTGLALSFWSGVYGPCIGRTAAFEDEAKSLATISGIMIAIGEVLGGLFFGIFSAHFVKKGRDPIVILGFFLSMVGYFLVFINIPNDTPIHPLSVEEAFITPNKYLALTCSFLLGLSDACFNTQVYSLLSAAYKDNAAPAFAIFKFMQSGSAFIAFVYAPVLGLWWQLLICVVFDILGTITFCVVEWEAHKHEKRTNEDDTTCGVEETPGKETDPEI